MAAMWQAVHWFCYEPFLWPVAIPKLYSANSTEGVTFGKHCAKTTTPWQAPHKVEEAVL